MEVEAVKETEKDCSVREKMAPPKKQVKKKVKKEGVFVHVKCCK